MLPKAIQQRVDEADRLAAELGGETPQNTAGEETPEVVAADQPPQGEQAQPEVFVQSQNAPNVDDSKWEQKYHSLKGHFDAEVPRLHQQNRELNARVEQLVAEVAKLQMQPPAPAPKAKPLVTDEDREAFGGDLVDLIDRAAEAKVADFRDKLAQAYDKIGSLEQQLGSVSKQTSQATETSFENRMTQLVPNWSEINVDSRFFAWLAEVDPVYGVARNAALQAAYGARDAERCATIFRAFANTIAPPQKPAPRNELQRQVAPARSRATSAPTAPDDSQRIYSQAEIAEFFEGWRRGQIPEADAVAFEQKIHAAAAEGRVR